MKAISALKTALVAVGTVGVHMERSLIMGGGFPAEQRRTQPASGQRPKGGALVSSIHVVTAASCNSYVFRPSVPEWVAVGAVVARYVNGSKDGEQIKVVSAVNDPLYNPGNFSYNFAVLTLEKPSTFAPIKLPAVDDSDIGPRMRSKAMGWGNTSYPDSARANKLQGIDLMLQTDHCMYTVDQSEVWAGGEEGKDKCPDNTGGPLIEENSRGDDDDTSRAPPLRGGNF
ncbi:hypothetical protein PHYSODRAFT_532340 [Phytophthora sojae]|uniref:Peptidase S1 domain-containing protein n=1 Tax=Phytophthora sojae (strain P6497) TaxID=1094619 RepID=G5AE51_PHYSP|nr:hypothetical protein PHYSODRAFT_532340 [Phytophthora sojae]EGZ06453.1 hypothetical protein PHYSODRAFT_532340 [Phytophthora sojae]|eukprot:XP_009538350.1 hypothetical protein PHYSODRAFT_532340 [Phytophthora sojae]